jgi:hypothetical protein
VRSPILAGPLTGAPVISDFDRNGLDDIIVASRERGLYIGYTRMEDSQWSNLAVGTEIESILSCEDLTGDENPNIMVGTKAGGLLFLDGREQKIIRELNVNEELNKAAGRFIRNNTLYHPVAFGDLNGDSFSDPVVCTSEGSVIAFGGPGMERLWFELPQPNLPDFEPETSGNIVIGDLDGDAQDDVLLVTTSGKLRAFKGTGQGKDRVLLLWEYPQKSDAESKFLNVPVLADFNKNGTTDVVIPHSDGSIYIFEGATGDVLLQSRSEHKIRSVPLVGDMDNNERLDILVLKSDGKFHNLGSNRKIPGGSIVWGQMFGNSRNTNLLSYIEPSTGKYHIFATLAVLMLLTVVGLQFWLRKRRKRFNYY